VTTHTGQFVMLATAVWCQKHNTLCRQKKLAKYLTEKDKIIAVALKCQ